MLRDVPLDNALFVPVAAGGRWPSGGRGAGLGDGRAVPGGGRGQQRGPEGAPAARRGHWAPANTRAGPEGAAVVAGQATMAGCGRTGGAA